MSASASETCVYHPDRPSAGHCSNCNQPVCLGCQMTVAGKNVCQRCVSAIRAQVAGQMNAPGGYAPPPPPSPYQPGTLPPGAYPPPGGYPPPVPPTSAAYQPYAPPTSAYNPATDTMNAGHVAAGIATGLLGGAVITFLWILLATITGPLRSLGGIVIGIVVGWSVMLGCARRGGTVPAIISVAITVVCMAIMLIVTHAYDTSFGAVFSVVGMLYGIRRAWITPMGASSTW